MPLEDLVGPNKFIDDLVKEWPLGIDPFAEGDDHIRGVKNVLANSFPTVAEARRPVSFREGANRAEEIVSAVEMAAGAVAQRPGTPSVYDLRVLTPEGLLEWWDGTAWVPAVGMLRRDNTWVNLKDVALGEKGPTQSAVIGPLQLPMGSEQWQVSPDDAARFRWVVNRDNEGAGEGLVVGAGVMVPDEDGKPDSFDLGRGTINTAAGVFKGGTEYGLGWTYCGVKALSGTSTLLATLADYPDLGAARDLEVFCHAVASSTGNDPVIRLGTGGSVVASGYRSSNTGLSSTNLAVSSITYGFPLTRNASYITSYELMGVGVINKWDDGSNRYQFRISTRRTDADDTRMQVGNGYIELAGGLDRVAMEIGGSGSLRGEAQLRFR